MLVPLKVACHFSRRKRSFRRSWILQSILLYLPYEGELKEHKSQQGTKSIPRTCFFVLGLISSTTQGAEILDDYRWEATLSPLGLPTGLCVPVDLDRFISVRIACICEIVAHNHNQAPHLGTD